MSSQKFIIIGGILLASVISWQISPPHIKDRLIGVSTILSNERQCFNFHKDRYKDPHTAYILSSYVKTKEDEIRLNPKPDIKFEKYDSFIIVITRAKNSFGAYGDLVIECPLIDGQFNETQALIHSINTKKRTQN